MYFYSRGEYTSLKHPLINPLCKEVFLGVILDFNDSLYMRYLISDLGSIDSSPIICQG